MVKGQHLEGARPMGPEGLGEEKPQESREVGRKLSQVVRDPDAGQGVCGNWGGGGVRNGHRNVIKMRGNWQLDCPERDRENVQLECLRGTQARNGEGDEGASAMQPRRRKASVVGGP